MFPTNPDLVWETPLTPDDSSECEVGSQIAILLFAIVYNVHS